MMNNLLTRGQLERKIAREIQAFYCYHLGHQPSKVSCQILDAKLAVIAEDSITNAELILLDLGKNNLAEKVRSDLDSAIRHKLKRLIEEITQVQVVDLLSGATLSTGRTGIIAILDTTPKVRNPHSIPKI